MPDTRSLAGQLYTAMTNMLYNQLIVHGYDGNVVMTANGQHLLIGTGKKQLTAGEETNNANWHGDDSLVDGFARLSTRRVPFGPVNPLPAGVFP